MAEPIDTIITLIAIIAPLIIGFLARQPAYTKAKERLSQARDLLDNIDDAIYDDKVTEVEFQKIFDSARRIIQKE